MSASTLAELAGRRPSDPAVSDGRLALDFAELEERSLAAGRGLEALGAGPGRHVAICVSNRSEFVELALGAWRAGCAFTPLKTGWTPGEVGAVLDDAGTAVVVTDTDGARAAALGRNIPVVDVDAGYERWLAAAGREPFGRDRCGYKMPYTSGTTGRPKGVVMAGSGTVPFDAGFRGLARWAQALELPGEGVHLFASRLFNGAPQTFGFGALACGAALRILPRWAPEAALAGLAAADVTSTIMVPTMFRQLLAVRGNAGTGRPAPGLATLLHGGEPCPIALKEAIAGWFGEVLVEYYGFTEGGLTVCGRRDWRERPGTVGRPLPGMAVLIRDDDGRELPAGAVGTVYFRSERGRRFAYAGDADKTEAAHAGDAFSVGDVGWLDADGYLYLAGRSADVIITAGVNVYPAEVEQALADVAGALDLCAVGVADGERGEVVALFAVPAPGVDAAGLRAALEAAAVERLAPYKRPREVRFVAALPRDETGKLLRRVVRERAAAEE